MSELVIDQKVDVPVFEEIYALCKLGLYRDALTKAENEWGEINLWQETDKLLIAVRLFLNLGGRRKSDALLLKLWRANDDCPKVFNKILFYKLNKIGPILASEFIHKNSHLKFSTKETRSDLLAFKSIIQKLYKNHLTAEKLLNEALAINPLDTWLTSLKIYALSDQNELLEAKEQAEKHFADNPSPYNLRVLSNILTKANGLQASIDLYDANIENYQSADLLFEYAQLFAHNYNWSGCEKAINQFEKIRIIKDKCDEEVILSWKAQIAIHYQQIDSAIEILDVSKNKYWQTVTANLKLSNNVIDRKILNVPFLKQEHMTCAPTSIAAICSYWGQEFDSNKIADAICFDGTPATKERQWLKDNNFYFKEFELDSDLAYNLIEQGIPFALVTTHEFSSHLQVVTGYNKQVGTLYVMDPSSPIMQELLTKETIESERYSGARCIAFVPEDKSDLLAKFKFPAQELFSLWDEFSLAEEQNDFVLAKACLEKLRLVAPTHRITLIVDREFAVWNNDITNILNLNNELLNRYHKESFLISSKFYCLRDLGKREEGLTLLSDSTEKSFDLDLLNILFQQIHDTNEHKELTKKTLASLKLYGGTSAYSHWSLANYYWSNQKFDVATDHYLYAYCLDETNNNFVESYFKATRFLKKEHESISFLKRRFDKYKIRSSLPAISLHKAYELLDQDHIGIDYLHEALLLHPDDTHLIKYLSEKLLDRGLIDRFVQIEQQIKTKLSVTDFHELIARKYEYLGDYDSSLKMAQQNFNENPLVHKYAESYFSILHRRGDIAQIDLITEGLYKLHGHNSRVLEYIADWHSAPVYREQVLSEFVKLRPEYGLIRRQLIDVRLTLGLFKSALEQATETCKHLPGELVNLSYLAKCHFKLGNFEEAKVKARQVLTKSVDNDLAFFTLMDSSISKEDKEQSLTFVFSEIKTQVNFGDCIWNFWFAAKSILSQQQLKDFIVHLLSEHSNLWQTYSLSANYYSQFDQIDKALELLRVGLNKFPLTPRLYSDLAQLNELGGDFTKAVAANTQALIMNPSWSDVIKRQCELLEKHEDLQAAIDVIKRGIRHCPNDGSLYGFFADLLINTGNEEEAIEALKQAVKYNTDYRWAWNQLIRLSSKEGLENLPYSLAKEISQQSPYLPHVWRDLAYLTDDYEDKMSLFDKSLGCDAYFIPTYQDKAQYFVDSGEYKEALKVFENSPWKSELPLELTIQKIDLLINIGQQKLAIDSLKKVLFTVHGHAYLWRKLFNLLEQADNRKEFIDCTLKSVEQNLHDPEVLCYAGENLNKHGDNQEKSLAQNYLKKAYDLSPNNEYIVLTYVDSLITAEQFEDANAVTKSFEKYSPTNYVTTRVILILIHLQQEGEAFNKYKEMILTGEDDYWCLNQSFIYLSDYFSFEQLSMFFKDNILQLNEAQAYFYTDKLLNFTSNKKYKHVLAEIDLYPNNEVWLGGFIALVGFWNDNNIIPPDNVINASIGRIKHSTTLISQLTNLYAKAGHYHSLIKMLDTSEVNNDLPAHVYYHYRLALQMLGRWDEAGDIILQGMKKQPDNTVHNLRLWYAYELFRTSQPLTFQEMEVIDYNELIAMEQYVYSTLLVSITLGNDSLETKQHELSSLLRKCQQDYQHTAGQELALQARKLLKSKLKQAITSKGFFNKLKLSWWVSNRF